MEQRPGKKHRNQHNNSAAKQQNKQIAKISPGPALDLPLVKEPEHRERQASVSRLRQQMSNHRPYDCKPPQQEYPFRETHIILFRFDKYATSALSRGSEVSSKQ